MWLSVERSRKKKRQASRPTSSSTSRSVMMSPVRLHGRPHPRHVSLVVGAPDVDYLVEPADQELVAMVGDVRGEVRRHAVAAHQHVVLVLAERGRGEPDRALALGDEPALAQIL